MRFLLLCTLFANGAQGTGPEAFLQALVRQAEAFARVAPTMLSEETLAQSARPNTPGAQFETHEVISEYGFAALSNSPNAIHEYRKAIRVDGKQVTTVEKARRAMTLGLTSADDKLKRRILEDFEKNGLRGAATDFGQVLLLFSARHIGDYEFEVTGDRQIGAERLTVLTYIQKTGDSGVTVFLGNTAKREPLRGEISVRTRDMVPLRITLSSAQSVRGVVVKEESAVDYRYDAAGTVLPVSVVHREYAGGDLVSENLFSYTRFRKVAPGGAGLKGRSN